MTDWKADYLELADERAELEARLAAARQDREDTVYALQVAEKRCVRAEEALRRIEELAADAKAELLSPQTSGDKRSVMHLLAMIESLAAVPEEDKT